MSGTQRMNALSAGNTIRTSAAVAELLSAAGVDTSGTASGASAERQQQDLPGLKAKDRLG